jgi:L-cystine uptake protein TcyP (sodium:dicarboxylate symporter family)
MSAVSMRSRGIHGVGGHSKVITLVSLSITLNFEVEILAMFVIAH